MYAVENKQRKLNANSRALVHNIGRHTSQTETRIALFLLHLIHVLLWIIFALLIRNTWHEFSP